MKITTLVLGLPSVALALLVAAPAFAQTTSTMGMASSSMMTSTGTGSSMTTTGSSMNASMGSMSDSGSMNFSMGMTGDSVKVLQQFLISKGYSIPAGATGYFGSQTQAALMMYRNSMMASGSSMTTTGSMSTGSVMSGSVMVPTTSTKAADLRATMHDLLEEHVSSSLNVLRAINDNNLNAEKGALAEQDANAVSLAAAIGSVYGTDAQAAFLTIFRSHITDSNAYTMALKNGSMTNQTQALADLDLQLQKISTLLSGANPNIDDATLLAALRQHESLVNQSSMAYNSGNYTLAYSLETQALTQIAGGADYLSGAIVKQYPDKFQN